MKEILGEGFRWIDVEHPSKADLEKIHKDFPQFHPLALEDTLSPIQRPKIDEFDDHLFIVLHFPVFEKRTHKLTSSEVDMFVGEDYIVTLHDGRLKPLTEMVDEVLDDKKKRIEYFGKDASYLVYSILNSLLDYCFPILYKNDVNLDILEDKIFEGGEFSKLVEELSIERRNVLNYRRIVSPQRGVLVNLEGAMKKMGFKMADVYFDDLVDHIEKIWSSLEEQKEVVDGLNEANLALVNTLTNDVVRVLTVITVIFLPLTLIASLYGMNVPLPFMESEYAFEIILGFMLALLTLMVFFFRKKHWI
ncbi:magnesium transporter CorA family protein [Patescibacteria group bacterium]|nr:magnesium transporter CorA family protein [Patescibacteria group bacterium]